jgi:hypothetical protein
MSTNGDTPEAPPIEDGLLITESVGGPHAFVERVLTVQSIKLPAARMAEVERIQISEKIIPFPDAATKAKA